MNRSIVALTGVAVTTAAVVAALAIPATAGTGGNVSSLPDGSSAASSDMATAVARDFGLTAEQARVRLANEERASGLELKLRKQLGASFSGAYLSADASAFTIAVSDQAAAAKVRAAGATARLVSHSERTLDAAKARLDANAANAAKSIAGWYVDVYSNTVTVLAHSDATATAEAFVAASGVRGSAVRVVSSSESPRTLIDVIGGNAYFIGGGRCSVGFSVTNGFVTAGHCGSTGQTTTQPSGTFRGSSFPGNDYAWVQVASGNTPRPWVNRYNGTNITVTGSQEAAVGASICRSGSTTGWHCGTIQAKNSTVNYPQGTVTGLTRTNVCAEPGDSGGSWLSGSQAQGVTSGGSGNCTSGGTTYFQPVNEILNAYGLTLLTSGSPPPTTTTPPPGGGCASYPNVYTGSLSSGASQYQPNGSYWYESDSGTHLACLDASSSSVDFDLYLQKWSGSAWVNVASATSAAPDETLSYSGTPGYYRYRVHAYSGSSTYTLGIDAPG